MNHAKTSSEMSPKEYVHPLSCSGIRSGVEVLSNCRSVMTIQDCKHVMNLRARSGYRPTAVCSSEIPEKMVSVEINQLIILSYTDLMC